MKISPSEMSIMMSAFVDEMEKIARVPRAVKQYRRALVLRAQKVPKHSTGIAQAKAIADEGLLRPGRQNAYGRGTYWGTSGSPTRYGPVNIAKGGDHSMIKKIDDPKHKWAVHRTKKGTPIGRGDVLTISKESDFSHFLSKARQKSMKLPARTSQYEAVRAARKRKMHVVEPEAEMAAAWRTQGSRGAMVGDAKKRLIKATRKYRKDVERFR